MKYMHLLPNSFSDLEKLRCSLFLASEPGRLWLTHFMLQLKYDVVKQKLSFSTDFIENVLSHFIKVAHVSQDSCLDDVANGLQNHCWLWCDEIQVCEEKFPCWIYDVDEKMQQFYIFRTGLHGLQQQTLSLNAFLQAVCVNGNQTELFSFSTDRPVDKFSPMFLQAQTDFFLDSMDVRSLEKYQPNLLWGLAAIHSCLQQPMLSMQNLQVLKDVLLFMGCRLQVWEELLCCNTNSLKNLNQQLKTELLNIQQHYTQHNKQLFIDDTKKLYQELSSFIGEVFMCNCL